MYADRITPSMHQTIEETKRRRLKQEAYNKEHGIVPTQIVRSKESMMHTGYDASTDEVRMDYLVQDPVLAYMKPAELEELVAKAKFDMEQAAKSMDFLVAAKYRDEMYRLQALLDKKNAENTLGS